MKRIGVIALLVIAGTCPGQNPSGAADLAGTGDPKGWFAILPDKVKWETMDATGRQIAAMFGDRTKPGLFGYLVRWPPNQINKAHTHPEDRFAYVISGTFYHGHGNKFDASKLERRPKGTVFAEPAGVAHFGGTKDEEVVIYFVGIGPDRQDAVEK